MRNTIKTEEIRPGMKAFFWEGFCLKLDNKRKQLYKDYDWKNLTPEGDRKDWLEFESYWSEFQKSTNTGKAG